MQFAVCAEEGKLLWRAKTSIIYKTAESPISRGKQFFADFYRPEWKCRILAICKVSKRLHLY
jgi:hypothetical protein